MDQDPEFSQRPFGVNLAIGRKCHAYLRIHASLRACESCLALTPILHLVFDMFVPELRDLRIQSLSTCLQGRREQCENCRLNQRGVALDTLLDRNLWLSDMLEKIVERQGCARKKAITKPVERFDVNDSFFEREDVSVPCLEWDRHGSHEVLLMECLNGLSLRFIVSAYDCERNKPGAACLDTVEELPMVTEGVNSKPAKNPVLRNKMLRPLVL